MQKAEIKDKGEKGRELIKVVPKVKAVTSWSDQQWLGFFLQKKKGNILMHLLLKNGKIIIEILEVKQFVTICYNKYNLKIRHALNFM
ncbi:MAG: hypothetical protein ACR5K4_00425 [Sodalis sp. (in: enterobacteria)]